MNFGSYFLTDFIHLNMNEKEEKTDYLRGRGTQINNSSKY